MRAYRFAAFAALIIAPTGASAETATSGKWFCRAERMIACDEMLACKPSESRVALTFDLDALTYNGLSVGTSGKLIVISKGSYGPSYSTGPGSLIEIGDKTNPTLNNRRFRLVALIGARSNVHVGDCNPL